MMHVRGGPSGKVSEKEGPQGKSMKRRARREGLC